MTLHEFMRLKWQGACRHALLDDAEGGSSGQALLVEIVYSTLSWKKTIKGSYIGNAATMMVLRRFWVGMG